MTTKNHFYVIRNEVYTNLRNKTDQCSKKIQFKTLSNFKEAKEKTYMQIYSAIYYEIKFYVKKL